MPPAAAPPAGGPAPPAPPLAAPAIPHSFSRCRIVGADNTLDYVCIPSGCKMFNALPTLEWIDASSIRPGHQAAPILNCAFGACAAATADWDTQQMQALLIMADGMEAVVVGSWQGSPRLRC